MTGLPLTATNEFGQTTATEYDDPLLRPTRSYALNFTAPESQTIYDDTARTVKVRKQIDGTNWDEATTFADSLGQTIKTVAKDSQGDVIVETKYDLLGRVQMVTNPYRQGETVYWSLTEYDELGRAKQSREPVANQNPASPSGNILGVTSYDLSTLSAYLGTVVTTTDAAGKKGRSITNALGQLIVVEEPDSDGNLTALPQGTPQPSPTPTPGGGGDPPPDCLMPDPNCGGSNLTSGEYPSYATYYRYDTLGKMVEVTQGAQKRWFKYDSLGRLIRVRQPEQEVNATLNLADSFNTSGQWTAGFTYDVLGNVLTATDANGTTITNTYDRAGRVKTRAYSDTTTPAVSFYYDGKGLSAPQTPNYAKGKLTKVTNSVSTTEYQLFDNLGRMTQMSQITDGQTYTSKYTYNFTGALVEEEYPSGRKVKNEFESDGDISRIYGNATTSATERTYANTFSYAPDGRIEKLRLGNGLWENAKFNSRLQVTELAIGHGVNNGDLWKLGYEYGELDGNGNVDAAKNTGNVARQTLSFNGLTQPFVQTYKYDSLYRLTEARETSNGSQTWQQGFPYDRYGNRLTHSKFSGINQLTHTAVTHPTIDPNTNRFQAGQGYLFDKNGNLTTDAEDRSFVFNGDNKQKEIRDSSNNLVGEYFYDGEGKRIKKKAFVNGVLDEETIFVYSSGNLIAEYSSKPPAQYPTTSWTITDQLGSPRVLVNTLGEVVSRRDFLPFGEEIVPEAANLRTNAALKYNGDGVRQKFTGYQKDEESGLDFAEARMYENRHGRFTAVDPLLASGKSGDPQTFNRYVYVMNNPLVYTDPTGLQAATNLSPCQSGTENCNWRNNGDGSVTAPDQATVEVSGWMDWLEGFINDMRWNPQDYFPRQNFFGAALDTERGQLGQANFSMGQNLLEMVSGNEEAAQYVHSGLFPGGPSQLQVLEETNAAFARAQFVNDVSLGINSLFLAGTQGYVAGSNFGRSGSFFGSSSSLSRGFGGQRLLSSSSRSNFSAYEVLAEVPISGASRSAHRISANNAFAQQLEGSAELRGGFNQLFGQDVLGHMNSGAGRNLLNPPGAVWHHPTDRPNMIQLLRIAEHRNPLLQPILHNGPNRSGGFARHFGRN